MSSLFNHPVTAEIDAAGATYFQGGSRGMTYAKTELYEGGIRFGTGSGAPDTSLSRAGVSALSTPGSFTAAGTGQFNGVSLTSGSELNSTYGVRIDNATAGGITRAYRFANLDSDSYASAGYGMFATGNAVNYAYIYALSGEAAQWNANDYSLAQLRVYPSGRVSLPTIGSSAGLQIGTEMVLSRISSNTLQLNGGDFFIAASTDGTGLQALHISKTFNSARTGAKAAVYASPAYTAVEGSASDLQQVFRANSSHTYTGANPTAVASFLAYPTISGSGGSTSVVYGHYSAGNIGAGHTIASFRNFAALPPGGGGTITESNGFLCYDLPGTTVYGFRSQVTSGANRFSIHTNTALSYFGGVIQSAVATGTAPFTVASTTQVTNLNADLLDGQHGSYYGLAVNDITALQTNYYGIRVTRNGASDITAIIDDSLTLTNIEGMQRWSYLGAFMNNALTNCNSLGATLTSSVGGTAGVVIVGADRTIRPSAAGSRDACTITMQNGGTAIFEITGLVLDTPSHAVWEPFVVARSWTGQISNIKMELRNSLNAWETVFDGAPTWYNLVCRGGAYAPVNYPPTGVRFTITFNTTGTYYIAELGLWNRNYVIGRGLFPRINAANRFTGNNYFTPSGTNNAIVINNGTTAATGSTMFQIGSELVNGSAAVAQINGLMRVGWIVAHEAGGIIPATNGSGNCGNSSNRWAGVSSVLGDFTGQVTCSNLLSTNTDPRLIVYETDTTSGYRRHDFLNQGGLFMGRVYDDIGSASATWLTVTRGAATPTVSNIGLAATYLDVGARIRTSLGTAVGGSIHQSFCSTGLTNRISFGLVTDETGVGNAGSNFRLWTYADNGAYIAAALEIVRATGAVTFYQGVSIANGLNISSGSLTVAGAAVATQSWVSSGYAPQGLATSSGLTVSGARILGRSVGGSAGAVEEIAVSGPLTLSSGTLGLSSTYVTGILGACYVSIIPQTDLDVSLGTSTKRWTNGYVQNLFTHTISPAPGESGVRFGCDLLQVENNFYYGSLAVSFDGHLRLLALGGGCRFELGSGSAVYPQTTNDVSMGSSSYRWSNTYSVLGNFTGAITAAAGVLPATDEGADLGSAGVRWGTVYSAHLNCEQSLFVTGDASMEGRLRLPRVTGTPTGGGMGTATIYWENATNKIWIYNGSAWKSVTLT